MGAIVVGRGDAQVVIGPELEAFVTRMLKGSAPTTMEVIETTTTKIEADAAAGWPVKTGRSKAALTSGTRIVSADVVEGFVGNDAPYAHLIKGKEHGGRQTWRVLLQKPLRDAADDVARALAKDLGKLAEGKS
jgi:hypothetical protein